MKLIILECTEEELKANRGILDAVVDAFQGAINTFYGSYTPSMPDSAENEEDGDTDE